VRARAARFLGVRSRSMPFECRSQHDESQSLLETVLCKAQDQKQWCGTGLPCVRAGRHHACVLHAPAHVLLAASLQPGACSAFSPVSTFMGQKDYDSVVQNMHLADGTMFGLPIVFDTDDDSINVCDKLLLTYNDQDIGTLAVDEKWTPSKALECKKCYGTTSIEHPAVQMVAMERGKYYLGGKARIAAACHLL
jgi:PUA-like domain